MTLKELNTFLNSAKTPEDVFGTNYMHQYRQFVKLCYPDVVPEEEKVLAIETFLKLHDWKYKAEDRDSAGIYGTTTPSSPVTPPNPPYAETTFELGHTKIKLVKALGEGLISSIHKAEVSTGNAKRQYFVKIARHPRDNDLLEREYRNLSILNMEDPDPAKEKFFAIQREYVPKPEGIYYAQGANGVKRRMLLLSIAAGETHTLDELLKMPKFKDGIERKHMYWIYRRILLTLAFAHSKKLIHGAVTPNHVLVYPKEHGLVLLDWSTSVWQGKEHIPLVDPDWKSFYPPEVFSKEKAQPNVDLYLAAQTMLHCVGDLPTSVRSILEKCTPSDPSRRKQDAMEFFEDFERAIVSADGPRKFVEMEI
jgi:serine/threonine protein kinase